MLSGQTFGEDTRCHVIHRGGWVGCGNRWAGYNDNYENLSLSLRNRSRLVLLWKTTFLDLMYESSCSRSYLESSVSMHEFLPPASSRVPPFPTQEVW